VLVTDTTTAIRTATAASVTAIPSRTVLTAAASHPL
jgi:hypothetical protein